MSHEVVLLDTSFFVATLNVRDALHPSAMTLAETWTRRRTDLMTHDAVLIELCNFFAKPPGRVGVAAALRSLRASSAWRIVPFDGTLLGRAEARFASHADKSWSMTDCILMELALEHGIRAVATADAHFRQAGLQPLLHAPSRRR